MGSHLPSSKRHRRRQQKGQASSFSNNKNVAIIVSLNRVFRRETPLFQTAKSNPKNPQKSKRNPAKTNPHNQSLSTMVFDVLCPSLTPDFTLEQTRNRHRNLAKIKPPFWSQLSRFIGKLGGISWKWDEGHGNGLSSVALGRWKLQVKCEGQVLVGHVRSWRWEMSHEGGGTCADLRVLICGSEEIWRVLICL